jgi:hypothetical protein
LTSVSILTSIFSRPKASFMRTAMQVEKDEPRNFCHPIDFFSMKRVKTSVWKIDPASERMDE